MDAPPPPHARPRRRFRPALSLRVLMLLVLVAGAGLGWIGGRARAQRRAVEAVVKMGGFVQYDYSYSGSEEIPNGRSRVPDWLLRQLGVDCFHRVTRVQVMGATPAQLGEIVDRFPALDSLRIHDSKITDEGPAQLPRIAGVQELYLGFCPITADGIAHVAKLPRLHKLDIAYTEATDEAIGHLARCRDLEELNAQGVKLTRKGIARLADLPALRRVNLVHSTSDSDELIAGLAGITRLESLELDYNPPLNGVPSRDHAPLMAACLRRMERLKTLKLGGLIDDTLMAGIGEITSLEDLDPSVSTVDDPALLMLREAKRLKTLDINLTNVTPAGISALQQALPALKITR